MIEALGFDLCCGYDEFVSDAYVVEAVVLELVVVSLVGLGNEVSLAAVLVLLVEVEASDLVDFGK